MLEVGLPVEARVLEPSRQHVLGALAHLVDTLKAAVAHREKHRQEAPLAIFDREETLMLAQGGHDHLARKLQVPGVEAPREHGRPLDQEIVDFDQRRVGHGAPSGAASRVIELLLKAPCAPPRLDQDPRALERPRVVSGGRELDLARMEKAMAARRAARLQRERAHRDRVPSEQGDQPAHRAGETGVVRRDPAHRLGELEARGDGGERLRQHHGGRLTHVPDGGGHVFSLGGLHPPHGGRVYALAAAEPEQGGRGPTLGVERHARRRPLDLLLDVGLAHGHAADDQGQAPWRAERFEPRTREAQLLERGAGEVLHLLERRGNVGGRQLFDTNLEQQVVLPHGHAIGSGTAHRRRAGGLAHSRGAASPLAASCHALASAGFTHFVRSASSSSSGKPSDSRCFR